MWLLWVKSALALTVGIVQDGTGDVAQIDALLEEAERLSSSIDWVRAPNGDLEAAFDALDGEVDVLLALGPVASSVVRRRAVSGATVITVFELPDESPAGSVIAIPVRVNLMDALDVAQRLTEGNVAVVVSDPLYNIIDHPQVLRTSDAMPEGVGAVVVAGFAAMSEAEQRSAYTAWNEAGLVSVVLNGEVALGATAAVRTTGLADAVGRQLAVVLSSLEAGEPARVSPVPAGELEVVLSVDALQALGLSAPFDLLAEARIVRATGPEASLTLHEVVATAFASSPSLQTEMARLQSEDHASWSAVARWAPQLSSSWSATAIDPKATGAVQPSGQVSSSLVASQLVWSDAAAAGVRVRSDLLSGRAHERVALEQDLAHDVLSTYIVVLRRQAAIQVLRADLDRVRKARLIAESQLSAGAGTPGDVARWESEEASARSSLVTAWTDAASASLALDQLRGVPGSGMRRLAEIDLEGWLSMDVIERPDQLSRAQDVLAEVAVERSPVVAQLDDAVQAQKRLLGVSKRAGLMPSVSGQLGLHRTWWQAQTDPVTIPGVGPIDLVPEPNGLFWTAGISATKPLFSGGVRRAEARAEEATLSRVTHQRTAALQSVETRTRVAVVVARAASYEQHLAQARVDAVHVSLDAVTDAYAAGAVPQARLTEVRTSALAAEIQSADADYAVLQGFVDLFYALSALPTPSNLDAPQAVRAALIHSLETP